MTDIYLVFPPDCREINEPCICTTQVASYIKSKTNNAGCKQYDANIEFMNYICSQEGFDNIYRYSQAVYSGLSGKIEYNEHEKKILHSINWIVSSPKEKTFILISETIKNIKNTDGYFKFSNYYDNKRILNNYISAIQNMNEYPAGPNPFIAMDKVETVIEKGSPYDTYIHEVLSEKIIAEAPVLVDIFITAYEQFIPALKLGKILKEKGIYVVISDFLPTIIRNEILLEHRFFKYMDGAIMYDQEKALWELYTELKTNRNLTKVSNFIYYENGQILCNNITDGIDVNELPLPTFDDFNMADYLAPLVALPYSTSKGCNWGKCKFCNFHKGHQKYSQKSPLKVVDELCALKKKYHISTFLFYDNILNIDSMVAIAHVIKEKKLEITWTAVTKITREISAKEATILFQSGCRMLEFEVETFLKNSHKTMDTGVEFDGIIPSLRHTKEAGIINTVCLLYGIPGEEIEDFHKTNDTIIVHKDIIDAIITFPFNISKDSIMWDELDNYKIHIEDKDSKLLCAYNQFSGETVLGEKEREEGRADIFNKTYTHYPYFLVSYLPIIHYVNHYQCNDPIKLVDLSDNREKNKKVIPKMSVYVMKLRSSFDFVSNKPCQEGEKLFLLNLINNKYMYCNEEFSQMEKFIDGIRTQEEFIDILAEDRKINKNIALIKYTPILKKYKFLMS